MSDSPSRMHATLEAADVRALRDVAAYAYLCAKADGEMAIERGASALIVALDEALQEMDDAPGERHAEEYH